MLDITSPKAPVEVQIDPGGKTLWINVDGKCVLRIHDMPGVVVDDMRVEEPE